ncbi:MAG: signal recognition particle-docking protein FtsY [Muribaculaceae bacterium]|nr:signal recognition particle-docking protein FtsY [Muribaculaceae bacterium]
MFFKFFGRKDSSKPQQTTSETPSTDSQTNDNANTIDSPRIDPEEEARQEQETLDRGLGKTKTGFLGRIKRAIAGRSRVDEDFLDELEEIFITSDIGTETSLQIIEALEKRVAQDKYINTSELYDILYDEIMNLLADSASARPDSSNLGTHPYVIMVVGVNGVGKTTTIGKLAYQYKRAGNKVILGAADTFRAAAIEQLEEWGRRAGVPVIKQQLGSDPAAVAFDTLQSAVAQDADVVIIDTAGRLHNKVGLMEELSKIKRVMKRVVPDAPHEVLLVLDGSTGQNAYEQARQFTAATDVTDLAVTKLDGTAKGGVVIGISHQMGIPVKYIGLGEGIGDIQMFDKKQFVKSLFKNVD